MLKSHGRFGFPTDSSWNLMIFRHLRGEILVMAHPRQCLAHVSSPPLWTGPAICKIEKINKYLVQECVCKVMFSN